MIAAVVIVGAVVSVFALSIGENVSSPAPSASFEFETLDDGDVRITHASGDVLVGDRLRFAGAALEKTAVGGITEWRGNDVDAGTSATVNVRGGEALRLIWQSPDDGVTATLATYDVPADANPTGSIGSVDTDYFTWLRGNVTINNIQFSRVHDDRVYIVTEDQPANGTATNETYFSTSGGDLLVRVRPDSNVGHGETITVTVYETKRKLTEVATATAVVP